MSPPTVIVLASGRGQRFMASGGSTHKLQALLAGRPVLAHTLAAVRASGLPWHLEEAGKPGMGESIAAAVRATADAQGWLILPGDLPLIQAQTLLRVAQTLAQAQAQAQTQTPQPRPVVVVPLYQGQRGHPVGFAPGCRAALLQLTGDVGAASVIRGCEAIQIDVNDLGTITDIDTVANLQAAEVLLGQRNGCDGRSNHDVSSK